MSPFEALRAAARQLQAGRFGEAEALARDQFLPAEEGLMFLFPSYFYHRTVPFESEQNRISIAFDIMPVTDVT